MSAVNLIKLTTFIAQSTVNYHYVSLLLSVRAAKTGQSIVLRLNYVNPFKLSFSEPKCARGSHIIFLESIFQHSLHEIVIYSINRKSYNKKVNIL